MRRNIFLWGLTSGVMAAIASLVWNEVYIFAFQISFPAIINIVSIAATCLVTSLAAVVGYSVLQRLLPQHAETTFNFSVSVLTIASLVLPLSFRLPLDIDFPEMFPALALPMHFFPALALFTLKPLFNQ